MTAASVAPVGTPGYLSPEQASGDELDGRSDLYAVGIILWELLAFRPLHAGEAGGGVVRDIPRPSELRPDVPARSRGRRDGAPRVPTARIATRPPSWPSHDLALCQATLSLTVGPSSSELLAERFPRLPRRPARAPDRAAERWPGHRVGSAVPTASPGPSR